MTVLTVFFGIIDRVILMAEKQEPTEAPDKQTLNRVKEIIGSKAWYGLDPETGAFNWSISINQIAEMLGFEDREPDVRTAFESGFTPDTLSQVTVPLEDGRSKQISLIEAVAERNIEHFIWTVGDVSWQKTKMKLTGAADLIDEEHFVCLPLNKLAELKTILHKLQARKRSQPMHVIVVDDKPANTEAAKKASQEYESSSANGPTFTIGDYTMKLNDPKADAQAFYKFLVAYQEQHPDEEVVVILDFDGVVANTDQALFGPVAEQLARLLS